MRKKLEKIRAIAYFSHKRESRNKAYGLGIVFVKNLLLLVIMWLVFTYGLGAKLASGASYFPYFALGFVAWTMVSETSLGMLQYLRTNKYMCENTKIKIVDLVIANVYKNFQIYLLLMIFCLPIIYISGEIKISFLYCISSIILLLTTSILTSIMTTLIAVKNPTIEYFMPVLYNILFWITPIAWSLDSLPINIRKYFEINPLYILININRNALLGNIKEGELIDLSLLPITTLIMFFLIKNIDQRKWMDMLK